LYYFGLMIQISNKLNKDDGGEKPAGLHGGSVCVGETGGA